MEKDPIIEEVRKGRTAFAARHGNDINAMCDALARRKDSVAAYVTFAPKRIKPETPRTPRRIRTARTAA